MKKTSRLGQIYTGIWMPEKLKRQIEAATRDTSDISKFLRNAAREKLEREGKATREAKSVTSP